MKKRVLAIVFLMVSLFVISGCTQRLVYESMQKVDDGVTGETFANVVDDSVWIFHSDGSYNWYQDFGVKDDYYYAGKYKVFRGQDALDHLLNEKNLNFTEADLNINEQSDVSTYIVFDCDLESTIVEGEETLDQTYRMLYTGQLLEEDGTVKLNIVNWMNGSYFEFIRADG